MRILGDKNLIKIKVKDSLITHTLYINFAILMHTLKHHVEPLRLHNPKKPAGPQLRGVDIPKGLTRGGFGSCLRFKGWVEVNTGI